jgi:hypothetical protein
MPMNYSLPLEPFDVWGFDFMGPFLASRTKHTHILVTVDYVTKWVEAITKSADHATTIKMLKDIIFPRFGVPRVGKNESNNHISCGGSSKPLACLFTQLTDHTTSSFHTRFTCSSYSLTICTRVNN